MQSITTLFQKQMSRKEFLQTLGIIVLTLIGLGALVKHTDFAKSMGAAPAKTLTTPKYSENYGQ